MKISSVPSAILSSILLVLPAAATSAHQERFDMVSILPLDGISVDERCSSIELRKLRDHTQLALNAVMMMNRDQVGDLHYNEAMDVDEYFGGEDDSHRQLERLTADYKVGVMNCGCTYRRAWIDPKRPQCREDGTVDFNLFYTCLQTYGKFVYHACHASSGCRGRRNLRSADQMSKSSDGSSSESAIGDSASDLFETIVEHIPERHRHLKKRGKDGKNTELTIGNLISLELTELISAEASMDGMYSCLEGVDFDVVVVPNANKLNPEHIWWN